MNSCRATREGACTRELRGFALSVAHVASNRRENGRRISGVSRRHVCGSRLFRLLGLTWSLLTDLSRPAVPTGKLGLQLRDTLPKPLHYPPITDGQGGSGSAQACIQLNFECMRITYFSHNARRKKTPLVIIGDCS